MNDFTDEPALHEVVAPIPIQYTLSQINGQFTPSPGLQRHLEKYAREYGAIGRTAQAFPNNATVWRLECETFQECGYAWWFPRQGHPTERDITIAVFDGHAKKGGGRCALQHMERAAASSGVTALCAQVNTNSPETGLIVRRWLARIGFRLYDKSNAPGWPNMSDEDYIRRYVGPVYMKKTITPEPR